MIWLDAHLSPRLAKWIRDTLGHQTNALRDLGLQHAEDELIFSRGREANVILITKDKDFADIVSRRGSPPQVIWLRCGNTSEKRPKELFTLHLEEALNFLSLGEDLVEIQ